MSKPSIISPLNLLVQLVALIFFVIIAVQPVKEGFFPILLIAVTLHCVHSAALLLSMRRKDTPGYPALSAFFVLFLFFFYVLRGWSFLVLNDDGLMSKLGVTDTVQYSIWGLSWLSIFICCFILGYLLGDRMNFGQVRLWAFFSGLYFRAPRLRLDLLAVGWLSVGIAFFSLLVVFLVSRVAGDYIPEVGLVGGFSGYVVALPFVFYGMTVLGWCLIVSGLESSTSTVRLLAVVHLGLICIALLGTIYFARQISTFRIYYLSPIAMIAFSLIPKRVPFSLFSAICIMAFPIITIVGNTREISSITEASAEVGSRVKRDQDNDMLSLLLAPYSAQGGDFTCLDIFASALSNKQNYRPWGLSYLYVFAHPIPRKFWPSKPIEGMLVDRESYLTIYELGQNSRGIPYTPGIVGDFYLEGGYLYIILGGITAGMIFCALDLIIRRGVAMGINSRLRATYAMYVFLTFFAVRSQPYQIVYYTVFISLGLWTATRVFPHDTLSLPGQSGAAGRGVVGGRQLR